VICTGKGNPTTWGRQAICRMIDWRKRHAKAGKSFVDPTSSPLQSQARDFQVNKELGPQGRWNGRGMEREAQRRVWWVRREDFLFWLFPTLFMLLFWYRLFVWKKPKRNVFPGLKDSVIVFRMLVLHTIFCCGVQYTTRPFSGRVR
jgi:hypothetical protein